MFSVTIFPHLWVAVENKVIGNIPYNISSQILFRLIEFRDHISSATLMFQKRGRGQDNSFPGNEGIWNTFSDHPHVCGALNDYDGSLILLSP